MEQSNILEAKNITKVYPGGVVANHNVNLSVRKGEIHALVGENGAGKSTLMKMLFGMLAPTEGAIFVDGKEVHFSSSSDAIAAGLGMVHQHFMQVPSMTVAENLILGSETGNVWKVDRKKAVQITKELSEKYNLNVISTEKVENISLAMRQKLEILKALYRGAHILILDEPTAVLTPQETEELFEQLKLLRDSGHTIIFISHKLNEVKELCNRMTILRDGKTMGTYEISDLTEQEISKLMVGRDVSLDIEKEETDFGKEIFRAKDLFYVDSFGKTRLDHVSFSIREGQILGIAGIDGNGQSEFIEALTGLRKIEKGKVFLDGKDITNLSVKKIRKAGMNHIPEDRNTRGLNRNLSIKENLIAVQLDKKPFSKGILLNESGITEHAKELIKKFDIRPQNPDTITQSMSGGNAQKVVVAREVSVAGKLLIASQPTRGAIESIRSILQDVKTKGLGVLLVSADLEEILSLSDRIVVMHEGKIAGSMYAEEANEENLGLLMMGGNKVREGEEKH